MGRGTDLVRLESVTGLECSAHTHADAAVAAGAVDMGASDCTYIENRPTLVSEVMTVVAYDDAEAVSRTGVGAARTMTARVLAMRNMVSRMLFQSADLATSRRGVGLRRRRGCSYEDRFFT
jgi:hypothetical protein